VFAIALAGSAVSMFPIRAAGMSADAQAGHLERIVSTARIRQIVADGAYDSVIDALQDRCPQIGVIRPTASGSPNTRLAGAAPEDPAVVQFTSGSTSHPKGAVITHRAALAGLRAFVGGMESDERDVVVSWLPHFHDLGLFGQLSHVLIGARTHVFSPLSFLRDPAAFLDYHERVGGTVTMMPNFGYDLINAAVTPDDASRLNLGGWRVALNAAEQVRHLTLQTFIDKFAAAGVGPGVHYPGYGLAEATLGVTMSTPGTPPTIRYVDALALANSGDARAALRERQQAKAVVCVGRPVEGINLRLVAASGQPVAEEMIGEIQISGASLMSGYLDDPQATSEAFDGDWLRTGDLGFTAGGELFWAGRHKEMIVVAGQNYFPEDVEDIARQVPGVWRGRCVATTVEVDQQERIAVIVEGDPAVDAVALQKAIRNHVGDALGLAALTVRVVRKNGLPRTTSGKWQRRLAGDLVDGAVTGRTPMATSQV
jgi:acyl-CoA synthetase (AMP-forming)/AMP-acid ligase II